MSKGLDLIQRQQIEAIDGYPTGNVYVGLTFEELAELEKELKALEVIKEKPQTLMFVIRTRNYDNYYYQCGGRSIKTRYTKEEYELLKETLL